MADAERLELGDIDRVIVDERDADGNADESWLEDADTVGVMVSLAS